MIAQFETELGYMTLLTGNNEVIGLTFGHRAPISTQQAFKHLTGNAELLRTAADSQGSTYFSEQVVERLEQFAEGEPVDFDDITVSLEGMTDFQIRVVAACRSISWGETVSYGELAATVGHPGAARAVGTVMSKNRVPLIVPCHRVLGAGGHLGGYSAPQGLLMKQRLLAMEKQALAVAST